MTLSLRGTVVVNEHGRFARAIPGRAIPRMLKFHGRPQSIVPTPGRRVGHCKVPQAGDVSQRRGAITTSRVCELTDTVSAPHPSTEPARYAVAPSLGRRPRKSYSSVVASRYLARAVVASRYLARAPGTEPTPAPLNR